MFVCGYKMIFFWKIVISFLIVKKSKFETKILIFCVIGDEILNESIFIWNFDDYKYITTKFKNKLIILDNASSHRNERIKELVNKHNNILYAVPYQHFTNSIENYFSMLKSRLQKLDGLTHKELKENIEKVIKDIPKEKYENLFKGAYNRTEKYVKKPSNRTRKLKNYLP